MAADKQEGIGSGITMKQKVIGAGVVIVVLIIIWQVVGLMSGGSSATPKTDITPVANKPATQMTSNTPNTNGQMPPGGQNAGPNAMMPSQQPQQPVQLQRDLTANNNILLLKEQQEEQKKYLSTVNELEMLKLQKDIAETNQAIAAAKLATVTAEKNINDLLTRPAVQAPAPVPAADYANKLVGVVQTGAPQNAPPSGAAYVVISVSMQSNKWAAVLGLGGKLYNVSVGDVLPVDGSIVVSINKSGVMLRNDGTRRKISLVPVI